MNADPTLGIRDRHFAKFRHSPRLGRQIDRSMGTMSPRHAPRGPRGPRSSRPLTKRAALLCFAIVACVVNLPSAFLGVATTGWVVSLATGVGAGGGARRDSKPRADASTRTTTAADARACESAARSCAIEPSSSPPPRAIALALPDPDPETRKPRKYSANHWFHVCEFHLRRVLSSHTGPHTTASAW